MEAKETTEATKLGVRGYICIFVLFIINMLNYTDRYTIAAVLTQVQKSYNINDAEAGLLQTVFIIFFMLFAPVFGFLGDRYNRKWIMALGIAVWVLAVFLSSFVPEHFFWVFITLRAIVGVGEASYIVIAPTIIADTFVSVVRSRVLMFFYFAIPLGSGVGYMVGSWVASLFNNWRWGIRVTPFFGVICLLLIIIGVKEPQRGEAENAVGAQNALSMEKTSFWEDVKTICKIPTFVFSTLGYTSVVFVTGTLGWWGPAAVEHAYAARESLNETSLLESSRKDSISFIFGAITLAGGILGVFAGGLIAEFWNQGKWCCKPIKSPRGNALVCAIGCLFAVPFLVFGMQLIRIDILAAWICFFLAITNLCLNWSTTVDILLDVVTPRKRGTATAWQTTFSHLFGDASGPYFVGLISDWIRRDTSPSAHFDSLVNAFYLPTGLLILGAILYFVSAFFFVRDRQIFLEEMGFLTGKSDAVYPASEASYKSVKDDGMTNEAYANSQL